MSEAARVVIMDSSLKKMDQLMRISARTRTITLQSALGGMALSGAREVMSTVSCFMCHESWKAKEPL